MAAKVVSTSLLCPWALFQCCWPNFHLCLFTWGLSLASRAHSVRTQHRSDMQGTDHSLSPGIPCLVTNRSQCRHTPAPWPLKCADVGDMFYSPGMRSGDGAPVAYSSNCPGCLSFPFVPVPPPHLCFLWLHHKYIASTQILVSESAFTRTQTKMPTNYCQLGRKIVPH